MVIGMANGMLRLVPCVDGQPDFTNYYALAMHDPENGKVRRLCTSFDSNYLYSCGTDGNIFSYRLNLEEFLKQQKLSDDSKTKRLSRSASIISAAIVSLQNLVDFTTFHSLKKNYSVIGIKSVSFRDNTLKPSTANFDLVPSN